MISRTSWGVGRDQSAVIAYVAQLQGILAWEAYSRLSGITAPTLVIHGERDRLVPPGNGKLIAERIPEAKLVMIPHASHLFLTGQTEAAHSTVLEFLKAQVERAGSDAELGRRRHVEGGLWLYARFRRECEAAFRS